MFILSKVEKLSTIFDLLIQFDKEFSPPLATRIESFNIYADKLYKHAIVIKALLKDTNIDVGFCAVYANDYISRKAYIAQLGVKQQFRGQGIGNLLISEAIKVSQKHGMKEIGLEVRKDNLNAIQFYRKFQFVVCSDIDEHNFYMKKTI